MEVDNQATSHKGEKLEAVPYKLSSILFLSHSSMEIESQKESSKMIRNGYENSIEKL